MHTQTATYTTQHAAVTVWLNCHPTKCTLRYDFRNIQAGIMETGELDDAQITHVLSREFIDITHGRQHNLAEYVYDLLIYQNEARPAAYDSRQKGEKQMSNAPLSHKHGGFLFRFTGLKFWEPEQRPEPTIAQASAIIDACQDWLNNGRTEEQKQKVVSLVKPFFPDWDGSSLRPPFQRKKKAGSKSTSSHQEELPLPDQDGAGSESRDHGEEKAPRTSHKEETTREPAKDAGAQEEREEAQEEPETKQAPKKQQPAPHQADTIGTLRAMIEAGLVNFWMYGPAGTGKTTMCRELAEELDIPCTILSCSAGTSPAEITGFKYPEPRASAISRTIAQPGIIVLDEMPMLEPDVAAVCNALLANNELETSTGHVVRDPECIIIATANTTGTGADRQYIGNNQLDAATLDRFIGGFVPVDYSAEYESQFDGEVVEHCRDLRASIAQHGLERIISTRAVIAAHKLKAAGLDWKAALCQAWTADEKKLVYNA